MNLLVGQVSSAAGLGLVKQAGVVIMASKRVRIEFFKVRGGRKFEDLLQMIGSKPAEQRVKKLDDYYYCLYDLRTEGEFSMGQIGRMSTDFVEPKGDKQGGIGPMPLNADEGQVTPNFFVYHASAKGFALPFQHSGVRASKLREYLNSFLLNGSLVSTDQIPRAEAISALISKVKKSKKLSFKLNVGANREAFRAAGLEDHELLQVARRFKAATIKIEISAGREQAGLHEAKAFFRGLLGHPEVVPSGELIGADEDGVREVIKLFDMMLRENSSIEITDRCFSMTSAYTALRAGLVKNLATIKQA